LERIDFCNKTLQSRKITVNEAAGHLNGLLLWLIEHKDTSFEKAMKTAKSMAETLDLDENSGFQTRKTRGRKPKRFRDLDDDGSRQNATPVEQ